MDIKFLSSILFVDDLSKSRHFYEQVLCQTIDMDFGLSISYKGGFALWQRAHANEVIFGRDVLTSETTGNPEVELGFEAAPLDEIIQRLDAAGVRYLHPAIEQPWRQRVVRFYDPDGHLIEMGEPMTEVVARLLSGGYSVEQVVAQTAMPLEIVQQIAAGIQ